MVPCQSRVHLDVQAGFVGSERAAEAGTGSSGVDPGFRAWKPKQTMPAPSDLVDIVRDFIVVHQRFEILFARFREGSLKFEEVRRLVADSDSSVLFRLKERVHGLFRDRDPDEPLRRGEALFDLAVGSLFHEAMKFRAAE